MKQVRKVIHIDEEKCTGCGDCIPNCPEGALQVIDGKARLVSDLFCDGLGACVGHCPTGAMTVEERPAEPYDEARVMANIVPQGPNTIAAHLAHLKGHGAVAYHRAAVAWLKEHNIPLPAAKHEACACPSSQPEALKKKGSGARGQGLGAGDRGSGVRGQVAAESELQNWPVQIMLVPVSAPYLKNADLLIAADCVSAAYPTFHQDFLRDRVLLIGCPKLDDANYYLEKLTELFRANQPKSVTCLHMEVPCCFGLVQLTRQAIEQSGRVIPFAEQTISIRGEVRK